MDRRGELYSRSLLRQIWCLAFTLLFTLSALGQQIPLNILDKIHYREIGPTRQGGRVVALSISQQDPYVFYVGAGPGGLWKTINNGHSFILFLIMKEPPVSEMLLWHLQIIISSG